MRSQDVVQSQVRKILSDVLERPIGSEEVRRENEPNWDSLRHVELLFCIEETFSVRLSEDEFSAANSLQELVRIVMTHEK